MAIEIYTNTEQSILEYLQKNAKKSENGKFCNYAYRMLEDPTLYEEEFIKDGTMAQLLTNSPEYTIKFVKPMFVDSMHYLTIEYENKIKNWCDKMYNEHESKDFLWTIMRKDKHLLQYFAKSYENLEIFADYLIVASEYNIEQIRKCGMFDINRDANQIKYYLQYFYAMQDEIRSNEYYCEIAKNFDNRSTKFFARVAARCDQALRASTA